MMDESIMAAPVRRASGGALVLPLLWAGGVMLCTALIVAIDPATNRLLLLMLASASLMPSVLNLVLAPVLAEDWAQAIVVLGWTALAGLAVALSGGMATALVLLFVLPLVVAQNLGGRRLVVEAAALAMFAVALVVALRVGGLLPSMHLDGVMTTLVGPFGAILTVVASASALVAHRQGGWNARSARLQLLRFTPDALVYIDGHWRNLATSPRARQILGGARKFTNVLDTTDRARFAMTAQRVLRSGKCEDIEVNIQPCTGADGAGRSRRHALALARDGKDALIVHMLDISKRTAREEQLVSERDAALQATQEKAQFLASVSHELRTPLNAIIGFSDMMKARLFGPLPAKYAEYADLIYDSGRHLVDLVGDVLDMSKIEARCYALDKTGFDACNVVRTTVKLMSVTAQDAGVALTTALPDGVIPVQADRKALRQILFNLISNAIKFTPAKGKVRVKLNVQDSNIVLTVTDNGVGMSPEDTARIGKPWQQAASAHFAEARSTGLGMALVQSLATLHGGAMHVHSELGTGTTVCIRLPVLDGSAMGRGKIAHMDVREHIRRAQNASDEISQSARKIVANKGG